MRHLSHRFRFLHAVVLGVAALASTTAIADTGLPSEYASAAIPAACRIDPFADAAATQRESMIINSCGGDHTRVSLISPRLSAERPETRFSRAEVGTLTTRDFGGLLSTVRVAWSGVRDQETGHSRSDSALLAAGGVLRIYDDVDVQMNVGRQIVGVPSTRATLTSSWRPTSRGMVYTEWSGTAEPGPDARRIGALLWLVPRKLSLDLGLARQSDSSSWSDKRIRLTLTGLRF